VGNWLSVNNQDQSSIVRKYAAITGLK